MRVAIKDIAYYLPEQAVTNEWLAAEHPDWDMDLVEARSGVMKRHIAGEGETSLDLAMHACDRLFAANEAARESVDCIIFCTQSPDYIMPPNATVLHGMLGMTEDVLAFDINLACSGFVYGLALAQGLIMSGQARNVLLVTAETYSKYIHRLDRSARVLFGDGAAVTLLAASGSTQGIIDLKCSSSGKDYDKFIIPAGGCRTPKSVETSAPVADDSGNVRTMENIQMNGLGILAFVNSKVPKQVKELLGRNGLTVNDIDLFVFHQASKMALDSLQRLLKISPDKVYRNVSDIGNTVSASIPIALKDAMDAGRLSRGDRVLVSGFGVGLSWATAVLEI